MIPKTDINRQNDPNTTPQAVRPPSGYVSVQWSPWSPELSTCVDATSASVVCISSPDGAGSDFKLMTSLSIRRLRKLMRKERLMSLPGAVRAASLNFIDNISGVIQKCGSFEAGPTLGQPLLMDHWRTARSQLVCNNVVMLQEAAGCPDGSAVRWSTCIPGEPTADVFPDVPFGISWVPFYIAKSGNQSIWNRRGLCLRWTI